MSPTKLIWNLTTSIVCLLPPGGTKHHREQVNPKKALLKLSPGALGKQRPAEGFRAVKWLPRAGIGQGSGRDRRRPQYKAQENATNPAAVQVSR